MNKKLGKLLQARRKELGLSISDVAHAAGIQYCTVARVERAECDPQIGTLTKILKVLRMSLEINGLQEISKKD